MDDSRQCSSGDAWAAFRQPNSALSFDFLSEVRKVVGPGARARSVAAAAQAYAPRSMSGRSDPECCAAAAASAARMASAHPAYKRARQTARRTARGLPRAMPRRLLLSLLVALTLQRAASARIPKGSWEGWWDAEDLGAEEADVEVVYLPALLAREPQLAADRLLDASASTAPLHYAFKAFGRSFELQLVPNRRLLAAEFGVWSELGAEPSLAAPDAACHYLHTGPGLVAAFSACREHALHGLIVTDNSTYEVRPLDAATAHSRAEADLTAHVVRRAPPPAPPARDARPLPPRPQPRARPVRAPPAVYTIEIALFLDEAAYKIFYPFCNNDEEDLRDMLLAYINGVQALYQHASLGSRIQLSLVRLTLLRAQPVALPAHAERGRLLDAFCAYQRTLNVDDDEHPQHWDMALLLSGLDLYAEEGGRRSGVTMGLAPVGGVCLPAHACVVAEFGADDAFGRPYPSAGFTSVYILAHEIGHNLGMHHDGTGNACATDGHIMSPSRGTSGEATWSPCSARVAAHLEWATCLYDGGDPDDIVSEELRHERFGGAPGATWGAKRQCELLLRDRDAAPTQPAPAPHHCAQLACRTPHRVGFYYAGPALPGTACGQNMWCQGGSCVKADEVPENSTPSGGGPGGNTEGGGWSPWRGGACRSACTFSSRGFRERRRSCETSSGNCDGPSYDVALCDDSKICGKKRRSSTSEFAGRKCSEFAALLSELDSRGGGLQAPHDPTRMWMGCAIFCRRAAGGGFYAPRVELNDVGLDPYFPDGTWCHHDGTHDYYCLQHHCLPENFKMGLQQHVWELPSQDVWGSFNARAVDPPVSSELRAYLSLDDHGTPLLRTGLQPRLPIDPEHYWEDRDYIEISDTRKHPQHD